MLKDALRKLVDMIPLLILAGVVWLCAASYSEHKLHVQSDENLTSLTNALVEVIRGQQGGGGQAGPGSRGNPDSALTNPTQELPTPRP